MTTTQVELIINNVVDDCDDKIYSLVLSSTLEYVNNYPNVTEEQITEFVKAKFTRLKAIILHY